MRCFVRFTNPDEPDAVLVSQVFPTKKAAKAVLRRIRFMYRYPIRDIEAVRGKVVSNITI